LRESKSIASLTKLLRLNDDPAEGLVSIGSGMKFAGSTEGFITDVGAVESQGRSFLIALALAQVEVPADWASGAPKPQPVPVVFLFDEEGRLIQRFGSRMAQNLDLSQSLVVTSFGTKDSWFVWVTRFDTADQDLRFSDIYIVDVKVRKVLALHHQHQGSTHSNNAETARDGAYLRFLITSDALPGEIVSPGAMKTDGVARDGAVRPARLDWNPKKLAFYGPSKITVDGKLVYEVDVGKSDGFETTDLSNDK